MDAYVRSMKYESNLAPGQAVIHGSAEGLVDTPGALGAGLPAGIYSALNNGAAERPDTDEAVPVTMLGMAKAVVAGNVTTGQYAIVSDETGELSGWTPAAGESEVTYGIFQEDGVAGEFVDLLVNIQRVTVPA